MVHFPPISQLRALDAAARHLSFTKAADELNVSQSAVSHQIKHLEDLWGLKLFIRLTRKLELTPEGRALATVARTFFNSLTATLEELKAEQNHQILRIQMLPSVAVKWLVPRLQGFRDIHPDIDVWISTREDENIGFRSGRLDAAIHLGDAAGDDLMAWPLMQEYEFPVARPRFLEERGMPQTPADLCKYPLLLRSGDIGAPQWQDWFEDAGVPEATYGPALRAGMRFPDSNMALQAAFEGQGITLTRSAPVWDDLVSGRLVRLFKIHRPFKSKICLVCPKQRAGQPAFIAFREWLQDISKISQAAFDAAELQ
ncbi:MAG: transcriptional regulator GcvA [Rhodospirillales bacterium]|nr:transcriptional regulator GcvA [Rhodospirillales bacterium]